MSAAPPAFPLDRVEVASEFLKRLSHPARLAIVCRLVEGEAAVGEMEAALGLSQPTLSQQLAELRGAGLVATRRRGKQVIYRLADARAGGLVETLHALFCAPGQGDVAAAREEGALPPLRPSQAGRAAPIAAGVFATVHAEATREAPDSA